MERRRENLWLGENEHPVHDFICSQGRKIMLRHLVYLWVGTNLSVESVEGQTPSAGQNVDTRSIATYLPNYKIALPEDCSVYKTMRHLES